MNFKVSRGLADNVALACDCFPGCWEFHSRTWTVLLFDDRHSVETAYRLCHQELTVGEPRPRSEQVGSGNYVLIGRELRFSRYDLAVEHARRLDELLGWKHYPEAYMDGRDPGDEHVDARSG